jgi:OFA family oxalate/formate antiporter-like MFS transporter
VRDFRELIVATHPSTAQPRIFYGWFVVAGTFAVTFVGFGCAYAFSAFVASLQQDFAASRGSVSLVFSLAGFLYFALGAVSGPLADKWGARRLAVVGMIVTGFGLALASVARTLVEIYAAYGLGVGIGIGLSYVPVLGVMQRWFVRRRGSASGIGVAGIGVGTLIMPPVASLLINAFGWRETYLIFGVFAAVVGGGLAFLIEDDPRGRGLGPDGDPMPVGSQPVMHAETSMIEAVKSRRFVGLFVASLLGSFGVFVPFVHLVPYALDHGVPQSAAVLLLGAIGLGSTAGRFFLGGVADRLGRSLSLAAMIAGMALAFVVWFFSSGLWSLAVFALMYGLLYGGWVALLPAVVADYFGSTNLGSLLGLVSLSIAFGTLIGPSAAGFGFDISHSYSLPILASAAAYLVAAAILLATAPRSKQWI